MHWCPIGNGCLLPKHLWYSLKVTWCMHELACTGMFGRQCRHLQNWMWAPIYITNPLTKVWFLNMEHPTHKIMWQMWFQLTRMLFCSYKEIYWDEGNFTYVYFHYPCYCVLACWQTSMVANGIGITYLAYKIVRQRLCKLYHEPQKLCSRKSHWDLGHYA